MTDPLMLLSQDHGEGRLTFRALKAGGFTELSSIADSPARAIADRGHFSMQTAQRLKAGAREMIRKGIGRTSRPPARGPKTEPSSPRAPRRFSEGVTRPEALTLQREEPRPVPEPPRAAPLPEPPAPAAPATRAPDETFWSFG